MKQTSPQSDADRRPMYATPSSGWRREARQSRGRQSRGRRAAFTLLEVLVALLFVAILLPVMMRALSLSAQLGAHGQREAFAVSLATYQLTEITATESWQTGDDEGDFETGQWGSQVERYQWTLTVDDWEDATMKELTVVVSWMERGREQSVRLTTVVTEQDS